jgi:hypothetical protein
MLYSIAFTSSILLAAFSSSANAVELTTELTTELSTELLAAQSQFGTGTIMM